MKKLYIMRHAQKNIDSKLDDFDVELTPYGIKQAREVGEKLKKLNISPDLIVASPSKRTSMTAEIISKSLDYEKNIMYNEVIYQAYLNELLEALSYTFDSVNKLFLIGHNPAMATLAYSLVGIKDKFEMGMVVEIDFNTNSWINIDKSNANYIRTIKTDIKG